MDFEIVMGAKLISLPSNVPLYVVEINDPKNVIEKVIFNDPATIVYWVDRTRTVVKAKAGTPFDPEKGLAMAISKKFLGNRGNYYDVFRANLKNTEAVPYTETVSKSMTEGE